MSSGFSSDSVAGGLSSASLSSNEGKRHPSARSKKKKTSAAQRRKASNASSSRRKATGRSKSSHQSSQRKSSRRTVTDRNLGHPDSDDSIEDSFASPRPTRHDDDGDSPSPPMSKAQEEQLEMLEQWQLEYAIMLSKYEAEVAGKDATSVTESPSLGFTPSWAESNFYKHQDEFKRFQGRSHFQGVSPDDRLHHVKEERARLTAAIRARQTIKMRMPALDQFKEAYKTSNTSALTYFLAGEDVLEQRAHAETADERAKFEVEPSYFLNEIKNESVPMDEKINMMVHGMAAMARCEGVDVNDDYAIEVLLTAAINFAHHSIKNSGDIKRTSAKRQELVIKLFSTAYLVASGDLDLTQDPPRLAPEAPGESRQATIATILKSKVFTDDKSRNHLALNMGTWAWAGPAEATLAGFLADMNRADVPDPNQEVKMADNKFVGEKLLPCVREVVFLMSRNYSARMVSPPSAAKAAGQLVSTSVKKAKAAGGSFNYEDYNALINRLRAEALAYNQRRQAITTELNGLRQAEDEKFGNADAVQAADEALQALLDSADMHNHCVIKPKDTRDDPKWSNVKIHPVSGTKKDVLKRLVPDAFRGDVGTKMKDRLAAFLKADYAAFHGPVDGFVATLKAKRAELESQLATLKAALASVVPDIPEQPIAPPDFTHYNALLPTLRNGAAAYNEERDTARGIVEQLAASQETRFADQPLSGLLANIRAIYNSTDAYNHCERIEEPAGDDPRLSGVTAAVNGSELDLIIHLSADLHNDIVDVPERLSEIVRNQGSFGHLCDAVQTIAQQWANQIAELRQLTHAIQQAIAAPDLPEPVADDNAFDFQPYNTIVGQLRTEVDTFSTHKVELEARLANLDTHSRGVFDLHADLQQQLAEARAALNEGSVVFDINASDPSTVDPKLSGVIGLLNGDRRDLVLGLVPGGQVAEADFSTTMPDYLRDNTDAFRQSATDFLAGLNAKSQELDALVANLSAAVLQAGLPAKVAAHKEFVTRLRAAADGYNDIKNQVRASLALKGDLRVPLVLNEGLRAQHTAIQAIINDTDTFNNLNVQEADGGADPTLFAVDVTRLEPNRDVAYQAGLDDEAEPVEALQEVHRPLEVVLDASLADGALKAAVQAMLTDEDGSKLHAFYKSAGDLIRTLTDKEAELRRLQEEFDTSCLLNSSDFSVLTAVVKGLRKDAIVFEKTRRGVISNLQTLKGTVDHSLLVDGVTVGQHFIALEASLAENLPVVEGVDTWEAVSDDQVAEEKLDADFQLSGVLIPTATNGLTPAELEFASAIGQVSDDNPQPLTFAIIMADPDLFQLFSDKITAYRKELSQRLQSSIALLRAIEDARQADEIEASDVDVDVVSIEAFNRQALALREWFTDELDEETGERTLGAYSKRQRVYDAWTALKSEFSKVIPHLSVEDQARFNARTSLEVHAGRPDPRYRYTQGAYDQEESTGDNLGDQLAKARAASFNSDASLPSIASLAELDEDVAGVAPLYSLIDAGSFAGHDSVKLEHFLLKKLLGAEQDTWLDPMPKADFLQGLLANQDALVDAMATFKRDYTDDIPPMAAYVQEQRTFLEEERGRLLALQQAGKRKWATRRIRPWCPRTGTGSSNGVVAIPATEGLEQCLGKVEALQAQLHNYGLAIQAAILDKVTAVGGGELFQQGVATFGFDSWYISEWEAFERTVAVNGDAFFGQRALSRLPQKKRFSVEANEEADPPETAADLDAQKPLAALKIVLEKTIVELEAGENKDLTALNAILDELSDRFSLEKIPASKTEFERRVDAYVEAFNYKADMREKANNFYRSVVQPLAELNQVHAGESTFHQAYFEGFSPAGMLPGSEIISTDFSKQDFDAQMDLLAFYKDIFLEHKALRSVSSVNSMASTASSDTVDEAVPDQIEVLRHLRSEMLSAFTRAETEREALEQLVVENKVDIQAAIQAMRRDRQGAAVIITDELIIQRLCHPDEALDSVWGHETLAELGVRAIRQRFIKAHNDYNALRSDCLTQYAQVLSDLSIAQLPPLEKLARAKKEDFDAVIGFAASTRAHSFSMERQVNCLQPFASSKVEVKHGGFYTTVVRPLFDFNELACTEAESATATVQECLLYDLAQYLGEDSLHFRHSIVHKTDAKGVFIDCLTDIPKDGQGLVPFEGAHVPFHVMLRVKQAVTGFFDIAPLTEDNDLLVEVAADFPLAPFQMEVLQRLTDGRLSSIPYDCVRPLVEREFGPGSGVALDDSTHNNLEAGVVLGDDSDDDNGVNQELQDFIDGLLKGGVVAEDYGMPKEVASPGKVGGVTHSVDAVALTDEQIQQLLLHYFLHQPLHEFGANSLNRLADTVFSECADAKQALLACAEVDLGYTAAQALEEIVPIATAHHITVPEDFHAKFEAFTADILFRGQSTGVVVDTVKVVLENQESPDDKLLSKANVIAVIKAIWPIFKDLLPSLEQWYSYMDLLKEITSELAQGDPAYVPTVAEYHAFTHDTNRMLALLQALMADRAAAVSSVDMDPSTGKPPGTGWKLDELEQFFTDTDDDEEDMTGIYQIIDQMNKVVLGNEDLANERFRAYWSQLDASERARQRERFAKVLLQLQRVQRFIDPEADFSAVRDAFINQVCDADDPAEELTVLAELELQDMIPFAAQINRRNNSGKDEPDVPEGPSSSAGVNILIGQFMGLLDDDDGIIAPGHSRVDAHSKEAAYAQLAEDARLRMQEERAFMTLDESIQELYPIPSARSGRRIGPLIRLQTELDDDLNGTQEALNELDEIEDEINFLNSLRARSDKKKVRENLARAQADLRRLSELFLTHEDADPNVNIGTLRAQMRARLRALRRQVLRLNTTLIDETQQSMADMSVDATSDSTATSSDSSVMHDTSAIPGDGELNFSFQCPGYAASFLQESQDGWLDGSFNLDGDSSFFRPNPADGTKPKRKKKSRIIKKNPPTRVPSDRQSSAPDLPEPRLDLEARERRRLSSDITFATQRILTPIPRRRSAVMQVASVETPGLDTSYDLGDHPIIGIDLGGVIDELLDAEAPKSEALVSALTVDGSGNPVEEPGSRTKTVRDHLLDIQTQIRVIPAPTGDDAEAASAPPLPHALADTRQHAEVVALVSAYQPLLQKFVDKLQKSTADESQSVAAAFHAVVRLLNNQLKDFSAITALKITDRKGAVTAATADDSARHFFGFLIDPTLNLHDILADCLGKVADLDPAFVDELQTTASQLTQTSDVRKLSYKRLLALKRLLAEDRRPAEQRSQIVKQLAMSLDVIDLPALAESSSEEDILRAINILGFKKLVLRLVDFICPSDIKEGDMSSFLSAATRKLGQQHRAIDAQLQNALAASGKEAVPARALFKMTDTSAMRKPSSIAKALMKDLRRFFNRYAASEPMLRYLSALGQCTSASDVRFDPDAIEDQLEAAEAPLKQSVMAMFRRQSTAMLSVAKSALMAMQTVDDDIEDLSGLGVPVTHLEDDPEHAVPDAESRRQTLLSEQEGLERRVSDLTAQLQGVTANLAAEKHFAADELKRLGAYGHLRENIKRIEIHVRRQPVNGSDSHGFLQRLIEETLAVIAKHTNFKPLKKDVVDLKKKVANADYDAIRKANRFTDIAAKMKPLSIIEGIDADAFLQERDQRRESLQEERKRLRDDLLRLKEVLAGEKQVAAQYNDQTVATAKCLSVITKLTRQLNDPASFEARLQGYLEVLNQYPQATHPSIRHFLSCMLREVDLADFLKSRVPNFEQVSEHMKQSVEDCTGMQVSVQAMLPFKECLIDPKHFTRLKKVFSRAGKSDLFDTDLCETLKSLVDAQKAYVTTVAEAEKQTAPKKAAAAKQSKRELRRKRAEQNRAISAAEAEIRRHYVTFRNKLLALAPIQLANAVLLEQAHKEAEAKRMQAHASKADVLGMPPRPVAADVTYAFPNREQLEAGDIPALPEAKAKKAKKPSRAGSARRPVRRGTAKVKKSGSRTREDEAPRTPDEFVRRLMGKRAGYLNKLSSQFITDYLAGKLRHQKNSPSVKDKKHVLMPVLLHLLGDAVVNQDLIQFVIAKIKEEKLYTKGKPIDTMLKTFSERVSAGRQVSFDATHLDRLESMDVKSALTLLAAEAPQEAF